MENVENMENFNAETVGSRIPRDREETVGGARRDGWRKVRLGEITILKRGKYVTRNSTRVGDIPVILGGQEPAYYCDESNHNGPCVVISRSGASAGFVSYWDEPIFVTDGFLFEATKETTIRYLYYALKANQSLLGHMQNGTGIPHVRGEDLKNFLIDLPPLPIQRRIAEVLGAYDDAIGNNRRRIALLEKMARELYRERFVRRAGKGEGMARRVVEKEGRRVMAYPLEQIAKFVRGKVIVKEATRLGDVPVVAGGLEPAYYHDMANTDAPVVTVSGSGANAGFARMYFEKVWASDCSWVDATTTKYIRFVYCFLKDNDAELRNAQKGAAQPHVHAKDVNALLVTAEESVIAEFEKAATPLFDEEANLTFQNRNLARQRDRLLPRLMSGRLAAGHGKTLS